MADSYSKEVYCIRFYHKSKLLIVVNRSNNNFLIIIKFALNGHLPESWSSEKL